MTQKIKATADMIGERCWNLTQEAQACPATLETARRFVLLSYRWAQRHQQLSLCDVLSGCMLALNEIDYCVEGVKNGISF